MRSATDAICLVISRLDFYHKIQSLDEKNQLPADDFYLCYQMQPFEVECILEKLQNENKAITFEPCGNGYYYKLQPDFKEARIKYGRELMREANRLRHPEYVELINLPDTGLHLFFSGDDLALWLDPERKNQILGLPKRYTISIPTLNSLNYELISYLQDHLNETVTLEALRQAMPLLKGQKLEKCLENLNIQKHVRKAFFNVTKSTIRFEPIQSLESLKAKGCYPFRFDAVFKGQG